MDPHDNFLGFLVDTGLFWVFLAVSVGYGLWSQIVKEERDEEIYNNVKKIKDKPYMKIYHGTVFKNISGSTIINGSSVINSINSIGNSGNQDLADVLVSIAEIIHNEGNQSAAELFEAFTDELEKESPKKSILSSLWEGITSALPAINGMVDVTRKIAEVIA
jgi:hypothetical protein